MLEACAATPCNDIYSLMSTHPDLITPLCTAEAADRLPHLLQRAARLCECCEVFCQLVCVSERGVIADDAFACCEKSLGSHGI